MQVRMKTEILTLALVTALGISPATAGTESSPWHSFVGVEGGLYDTSDSYLTMIEGGIGYGTGPLIHYLLVGGGRVHRDDEHSSTGSLGGSGPSDYRNDEDVLDEFELGYRLVYPLNEKLSVFAEIGAESFRGKERTTDALGNRVSLSLDSDHYFLGTGFRVPLWKGLNVDFSLRYLLGMDNAAFSHTETDALGNPMLKTGDTPNILVRFGVSYCL